MRPYYAEGSKTLAFETVEQLGWELPDRIVGPIASGSQFTKIARGFQEFIDAGLVSGEVPKMNGAQAEGCSPVAKAFAEGHDIVRPVKPNTIAKSLAIGNPADGPYAIELARRTGGGIDCVNDDEIRAGIRLLAETTGIFTESAGGVTIATLAKLAARGDIGPDERVVAMVTGDGLKTIDVVRGTFEVTEIPASHRRLRRALRAGGRLMAVTVKLPTQLRDAAGGATAAQVEGGTVGEALDRPLRAARRAARADRRRRRLAAALRQRLPQGRGHPLPRRARDPGRRRRRGHDPPGRGGRLTMRIDERLRDGEPIVSFEFLPPRTVEAELAFWSAIEELAALEPAFVSVTCGAGGTTRDLTLAVVRRLARERGLEAVPHVTATGFTPRGPGRAAGRGARRRRRQRARAARRPAARRVDLDRARGRRRRARSS